MELLTVGRLNSAVNYGLVGWAPAAGYGVARPSSTPPCVGDLVQVTVEVEGGERLGWVAELVMHLRPEEAAG